MRRRVFLADLGRDWRGGQNQTAILARSLAKFDWDCALLAHGGSGFDRIPGINVVEVGALNDLDPRPYLKAARILSDFRPHILHASEPRAHRVLASLNADLPLVVTRRIQKPPRMSTKYRATDLFITLSASITESLVSSGVDPARCRVIPPAVQLPSSPPDSNKPTRFALTLSAVEEDKGAIEAGQAARILKGLDWRWAGIDKEPASRRGWPDNLSYINNLRSVDWALGEASLLVCPSRSEGFGTAILQGLAYGLPIVSTDTGAARELIGPEVGTICAVGDHVAMAAAVERWMEDKAGRIRAAEKAPEIASDYGVDWMVRRTIDAYEKVLASRDTETA